MFDKDIVIKGKHATYLKQLSKKTEQNLGKKTAGIFERNIDVYMTAAVVGLFYGLKTDVDNSTSDSTTIFADAQIKEKYNLDYIYKLCMLVDNSSKLSNDDKISRAFKDENELENFKLFSSYVRGGIEYLYEKIALGVSTKDEYFMNVLNFVNDYSEELSL